jgi:hypothetical protein
VLEHRTGDHLTNPLAGEPEPGHQTVQCRGEHVLIGRMGVRSVRTGKRDPVAAEHGHAANLHHTPPGQPGATSTNGYPWVA